MMSDFRLDRHFKSNVKVFYSDGTFKNFIFSDYSAHSSFVDRVLDDSTVSRIEISSHSDMIFDIIFR